MSSAHTAAAHTVDRAAMGVTHITRPTSARDRLTPARRTTPPSMALGHMTAVTSEGLQHMGSGGLPSLRSGAGLRTTPDEETS